MKKWRKMEWFLVCDDCVKGLTEDRWYHVTRADAEDFDPDDFDPEVENSIAAFEEMIRDPILIGPVDVNGYFRCFCCCGDCPGSAQRITSTKYLRDE